MSFDSGVQVLPLELFALIVNAAREDLSTLRNLCLVSKCFLEISQHSLYRKVRLGGIKVVSVGGKGGRWSILNTNTDAKFFKSLASTSHLAQYVRDFSFRPDTGHTSEYFWDAFHQALHLMVNLKYLQLTLMANDRTFYRILENLYDHPFQLEVFSWKDYRRRMTDQDVVAFLSFIASQPRLRTIDILTSSNALLLPPESCSNLTTFVGEYGPAASILRDRSVTNFVWLGGQLDPVSFPSSEWATIFSNLRLLVFFNQFSVNANLADLLSQLPSLMALQISFESHTVPGNNVLNKATELLQSLPELRQLRVLIWTGMHPVHWCMSAVNWLDGFRAAAGKFFGHPKIERVYLSCSSGDQERLLRWNRDGFLGPRAIEVDPNDLMEFYHSLDFDGNLIDREFIYGR